MLVLCKNKKLSGNEYFAKIVESKYFVLLLFLVLPWLVFFQGINPFIHAIAPGDGSIYGVQMQEFTKSWIMWNPFLASGKPQLAEVGSQTLYLPAKIIMNLFPTIFGYNVLLLLHYSFAGYFTYKFLKINSVKQFPAVLGGISFMFCGFMVAHKGHNTMICTAAYLPCILYLIEKYVTTEKKKYLLILTCTWALSITADYTASSMYIGMVSFPYIIYRFLKKYGKKEIGIAIMNIVKLSGIVYVLGTLMTSFYLFPILESLKYVTRENITYEFFSQYSFPLRYLGLVLFPFLLGDHVIDFSEVTYYGEWNLTELAGYMGILVLVIAISIIFYEKKDSNVKFWTVVAVVSFILVLGDSTPLYRIMYHVPLYNMFRVSARNWLEVNFAICVLFSFGLDRLIRLDKEEFIKLWKLVKKVYVVLASIAIGIIFCSQGIILLSKIFTINSEYIYVIDNMTKNNSLTSRTMLFTIFVFIATGVIIALLKEHREKSIVLSLIAVLLIVDLYPFAHYHDLDYPVKKDENVIVDYLKNKVNHNDEFRIWNLSSIISLYPTTNQNLDIKTINSYGPVWLKNYAEITGFDAAGNTNDTLGLLKNTSLLSMLGTKYLIVDSYYSNIIEKGNVENENVKFINNLHERWEYVNSSINSDGIICLNAKDAEYSLCQYQIGNIEDIVLQISFDASAGESLNQGVYVDLYNENGTLVQKYYTPEELISKHTIVDTISKEGIYENVYLRIFTYAHEDLYLGQLEVEEQLLAQGTYIKCLEDGLGNVVYENTKALERAYFVEGIQQVEYSEQIDMIKELKYLPNKIALTEDIPSESYRLGKIENSIYENDEIRFDVSVYEKGFLVLTDNYYPGWNAYIDGVKTDIYKVNATQQGILIKNDGSHLVTFKYEPISFYWGTMISTLAFLLLLVLVYYRKFFSVLKCKLGKEKK